MSRLCYGFGTLNSSSPPDGSEELAPRCKDAAYAVLPLAVSEMPVSASELDSEVVP